VCVLKSFVSDVEIRDEVRDVGKAYVYEGDVADGWFFYHLFYAFLTEELHRKNRRRY
jgi:hypothetical protein